MRFTRCVIFSERQEVDDVMRWEFPFERVTKLLLFSSHVMGSCCQNNGIFSIMI